jgi:hypothetical protein
MIARFIFIIVLFVASVAMGSDLLIIDKKGSEHTVKGATVWNSDGFGSRDDGVKVLMGAADVIVPFSKIKQIVIKSDGPLGYCKAEFELADGQTKLWTLGLSNIEGKTEFGTFKLWIQDMKTIKIITGSDNPPVEPSSIKMYIPSSK